ncbi:MAG: bifunctional nuclease family protein [Chloroflexota bacterium]
MVEVKLHRVAVDPQNNQAVLLLRDENGRRVLPLMVGALEASSIALAVENIPRKRPLTHDLIISLLELFGASLKSVLIDDVRDDTFFAQMTLAVGDEEKELDCRPSDAIALAARTGVPIFALEKVLALAGVAEEE